jgi:arylsulfatase A-like enzyme
MTRQLAPTALILTSFATALSGCGCKSSSTIPASPRTDGVNVVFVSFDALQAAHVSSLGYPRKTTPTIDAMADSGFNFTNAISVSSWTVPASMTWFTGIYPSEHRMTNKFAVFNANEQRLAKLRELTPNVVTLAEILKHNGYATAAFTGNAGVNGGFGYEEGFDVYDQEVGTFGSLDRSIPAAIDWLREHKDQKFFLFLHGYDIHGQSTPASGFDFRFVDKDYDKRFTGSEQEQERLREEGLEKGQLTLRDEDVRFWRAIYDEKIRRTDEKFRHFLAEFEKLGLTDKTLFVLTSDHGTEIYEHRRFDHGYSLYNELIHVPLIVKLPKQTEGKRITDRVSSIDLMPTILDALQISLTDVEKRQLRGRSLMPATRGEWTPRDVFSETDYREYTYKRSIATPDGWKLIYTLENRKVELFNLNDDPGELKNLAEVERNRSRELEEKLFKHFASIGHDLGTRRWEIGLNPVYSSQGGPPKKK